ncbi:adenylyl cyclase-associated protein [Ditylenchus destructor]|uniref:Adenylyl cyclase-associated protein n=1 Tax=Ditylenchus destructor TaxID=166010 RepID=A0AAD4N3I1_9BILA|nr:adenylyl cyclase-associated protein [Ditylenchus destructor]
MEDSLVKRLEVAVSRLEAISSQKPNLAPKPTSNGGTSGTQLLASNEVPESVRTYDDHMDEPLKTFFSHCTAIGRDLAEASSKLRIVFDLHRNFLWSAAGQAEPSDATALQSKLSPILTQVQNFTSFKDSKKTSPQFQHLAAIAEGMPAVFWVTVKKTPAPYVKEISDGAVPADGPQTAAKAAPAKAGGPPPPPPPPPAGLFAETKPSDSGTKNVREALFAEINKGDAITSGLKKVTADMQTHKNPTLRVQNAPVPGSKPNVTPKPGVFQIKGKVNSVTIDSCKKSSVVFENLLAQIEVINCQSIKVQTLGTLPTISIQKTDGCQVYLSNDSLNAEIVTSKSSEMNVLAPIGDDGDFVEFPIPEQFKTTLCAKTKKLTTVASDIV